MSFEGMTKREALAALGDARAANGDLLNRINQLAATLDAVETITAQHEHCAGTCSAAGDVSEALGASEEIVHQRVREIRAGEIVAFGAVFLPLEHFEKARRHADEIREGRA